MNNQNPQKNNRISFSKSMYWLLFSVGLVFLLTGIVFAQTGKNLKIGITRVVDNAFPRITVYLTVLDEDGLPVAGLTEENFDVFEDENVVPKEAFIVDGDTTQPLEVVLALDLTLDFLDDLDGIKAGGIAFVETLRPEDRIILQVFHNEVEILFRGTGKDRAEVIELIENLEAPFGRTAFYVSAQQAIETLRETPSEVGENRRAVILLTNIGNNIDDELAEAAKVMVEGSDIPVHIVSFGNRAKIEQLREVTSLTSGQPFILARSEELPIAVRQLSILLRQGYKLTYRSAFSVSKGEQVLTIQANTPQGRAGETQLSFIAGGDSNENCTGLEGLPCFAVGYGVVAPQLFGLKTGQVVTETVQLTAEVSSTTIIDGVTYWLDGEPLVTATEPPYTYKWNSKSVGSGPHSFKVVGIDQAGNIGESETINFEVAQGIEVIVPTARVILGDPVPLEVVFDKTIGTNVEILLDDEAVLHRVSNPEPPYSYSFTKEDNYYPLEPGIHTISIVVRDGVGQIAKDSYVIQFIEAPPPPQPQANWTLVICYFILLDIAALLLLALFLRKSRDGQQRLETYRIRVKNLGNMPSGYRLAVEMDGKAPNIELKLETEAPVTDYNPIGISAPPQLADGQGNQPQGNPSGAAPANGQAGGGALAQGASGLAAAGQGAASVKGAAAGGAKQAKQAAKKASGGVTMLADILTTLSVIPGIGPIFRGPANMARKGQMSFSRMTRAPQLLMSPFKRLGALLPGFNKAKKQAQKAASSVDTANLPKIGGGGNPASTEAQAVQPNGEPVQIDGIQTQVVGDKVAYSSRWGKSPNLNIPTLESGDSLDIDLLVRPIKPPGKRERHKVQITSNPNVNLNAYDENWHKTQEGHIEIQPVAPLYRFNIPLIIAVLLFLCSFHLWWINYIGRIYLNIG